MKIKFVKKNIFGTWMWECSSVSMERGFQALLGKKYLNDRELEALQQLGFVVEAVDPYQREEVSEIK